MTTERDIQFSLRMDRLAASIASVETALRSLRAEYEDLVAVQRAQLDDDSQPHPDREWLGHRLVERASELLRATTHTP